MKLFLTFHYQEKEHFASWLDADWVLAEELVIYRPSIWKRYAQYALRLRGNRLFTKDRLMEDWKMFSKGTK